MPDIGSMVMCGDQVERLRSDCRLCYDGEWYLATECVDLPCDLCAHRDDENIVRLHNGRWSLIDDASEVHGEWYPNNQVRCCTSCDDNMLRSEAYHSPAHEPMCESCWDDACTTCDSCGETIWRDDAYYDDNTEERFCETCWNEQPRLISDYSDRSANTMPPVSQDKVLYGVELEVESRTGSETDGAEWVRRYLANNYCVFKRDGSLGAGGFEIVTRPDSVDVHRHNWAPLFNNHPEKVLRSWTTGRCGMHVHVSRAPLSQLQIGKMLVFLNEPANERLVHRIAGRKNSSWAKVSKKKLTEVKYSPDRYSALNLTNRRTIEFRIFKGTLNKLAFFKNLEFCMALVEFCAPANRGIAEATSADAFLKWLPYKDYPHLYEWLVLRGLIEDRRPKKRGEAA